jgi:hypothetical protein
MTTLSFEMCEKKLYVWRTPSLTRVARAFIVHTLVTISKTKLKIWKKL